MNKYLVTPIMLFLVLCATKLNAQTSQLLDNGFWKAEPNLATVKSEVEKGFDFSDMEGGENPILMAMRNKAKPEITKYLLSQPGVALDQLLFEGRIYLHIAANSGEAKVADYLLEKGSDMYFLDGNAHTAFTFAAFQGHLTKDMIDVFIKHGVDLQKRYESKQGANILLLAVCYDKDLTITDHFVSKGLSLTESKDDEGNKAFNHAAKIGYVPMMKELLKRGVEYNENALIMASQGTYRTANSIEVYKYLVDELKIDPKTTTKDGRNVLHSIAGKRDQAEVVNYFLEKGVDVNKTDNDGKTPFFNAAGSRNFDVVELMYPYLKKGNINATNHDGQTALMLAAASNEPKTLSFLMEKGANVKVKDKLGNDAGYYLVESYRPAGSGRFGRSQEGDPFGDKWRILVKAGLDPNTTQKGGNNLLHLATEKNDLKLIKTLVEAGTDINKVNAAGNSVLQLATMKATDDKILKYLVDSGADTSAKTAFGETAYDLAMENAALQKTGSDIQFLK